MHFYERFSERWRFPFVFQHLYKLQIEFDSHHPLHILQIPQSLRLRDFSCFSMFSGLFPAFKCDVSPSILTASNRILTCDFRRFGYALPLGAQFDVPRAGTELPLLRHFYSVLLSALPELIHAAPAAENSGLRYLPTALLALNFFVSSCLTAPVAFCGVLHASEYKFTCPAPDGTNRRVRRCFAYPRRLHDRRTGGGDTVPY